MCIDFSASLCFIDSYPFLYLLVFFFVEEFSYATLCMSSDYPHSVLFCFPIVISFPPSLPLFCSYSLRKILPPNRKSSFQYLQVIQSKLKILTWRL